MDHYDLIAELPIIEKLTPAERIRLARQRRALQLVKFCERHDIDYETNQKILAQRPFTVKFGSNITLLESTARNDYEEIRQLLENGIDPNVSNEDGLSALHQCSIDNNERLLLLLIKHGANVNARDTELWTPLHAAACCGYTKIVKHLIDSGAELLAVNADGNMPYDICDDEETLDYIESEMAKKGVTQEDIDEERLVYEKQMLHDMEYLLKNGKNIEFRDEKGATPLHVASAKGYYTVVKYLLEIGASVHVRDNDGWQPIHAAACWAQPDSIELLVNYGSDINARTPAGETPFDLCEDESVRALIMTLQLEQRRKLLSFARDSRRMSKRRKPSSKFESPNQSANNECNRLSASRGAIRRHSLRDRAGVTLARLEAQREAAVFRRFSFEACDAAAVDTSMDNTEPTTSKSLVGGGAADSLDLSGNDQSSVGSADPILNPGDRSACGGSVLEGAPVGDQPSAAINDYRASWTRRPRKLSKTRAKNNSNSSQLANRNKLDGITVVSSTSPTNSKDHSKDIDDVTGTNSAKSMTLLDLKRLRSFQKNSVNNKINKDSVNSSNTAKSTLNSNYTKTEIVDKNRLNGEKSTLGVSGDFSSNSPFRRRKLRGIKCCTIC